MKRTLLLSALAALTLSASAQIQGQEINFSGRNLLTIRGLDQKAVAKSGKLLRAHKMAARITQEKPIAFYVRPAGCFWIGIDKTFNGFHGYAIAPANTPLQFGGAFRGEKSKWVYADPAQNLDGDDADYTYLTKEVTAPSDSVLTITYPTAALPAPQLICSSKVGTSALKAKTEADTFSLGDMVLYGGSTHRDKDLFPAVNYDLRYMAGMVSIGDYFGLNNAAANANITKNLGRRFGNSELKVSSSMELFMFDSNASAYILGGEVVFYADGTNEVKASDVEFDLIPLENGRPSTTPLEQKLTADNVSVIPASGNNKAMYVVHFKAEKAILTKQSVLLRVRPSASCSGPISVVPMISGGISDGQTAYAGISFTYNNTEYKDQPSSINIFQFDDKGLYHAYNWIMGLDITYNQEEANTYTGISTPAANVKQSNVTYDLQGHRVAKTMKGLYIQDGKKIYVK